MPTQMTSNEEWERAVKKSFDYIWTQAVLWERNKLPGKEVPTVYEIGIRDLRYLLHSQKERVVEMIEKINVVEEVNTPARLVPVVGIKHLGIIRKSDVLKALSDLKTKIEEGL